MSEPTMEQMLEDFGRAYARYEPDKARTKLLARFSELERERDEALRESTLLTRKILTCGVAASHPNPELSRRAKDYGGPWDSPQAEEVRKLRAERDAYKADAERYEIVRCMVPRQFQAAWTLNIRTGKPFDEIIDDLRPFAAIAQRREKNDA